MYFITRLLNPIGGGPTPPPTSWINPPVGARLTACRDRLSRLSSSTESAEPSGSIARINLAVHANGIKGEFALTAKQGAVYVRAMRLSEYLAKNDLNPEQFAARVGVHPTTIYRLLSGATIPKRQNLKKIIAATEGQVDISDLMFAVSSQAKQAEEPAA